MKYLNLRSAAISLSVLLSACANVHQEVAVEKNSPNLHGLTLDESHAPTMIFKREGAPGLERYTKFIIDPVTVSPEVVNESDFDAEELSQLRTKFETEMTSALTDAGYQVDTEDSADALRIAFTLSDLEAPSTWSNLVMLVIPGWGPKVGEVTIEASFIDVNTGDTNAVVIDNTRGAYFFNKTPWTSKGDIEESFEDWAVGFVAAVNSAHSES